MSLTPTHYLSQPDSPVAQFAHQAKTWPWHLRVLVKVECGPEGTNTRFVVTNRPGEPRRLFHFYEGRGQAENYITGVST